LAAGKEASVLLEVEVTDTGRVFDARVIEGPGEGFDEAAVDAVLGYLFTPATDAKGQPVASVIQYRLVFKIAAAAQLVAEGTIREAGTRVPLQGVIIEVSRPDSALARAVTDDKGNFEISGLADGAWTLKASGPGLNDEVVTVNVAAGKVQTVALYLVRGRPWEESEEVSEVVEIVGKIQPPEIVERRLTANELRYLPGTNGDVVRGIQNLPGIARPPLNIGQLIIRGTAPEDSAYYFDGGRIPLVFHFAGFSTVINSDVIEQVAFLPGNYGVRYGRTLGGVVDIRTTSVMPERTRGYVSVDLFQATGFAEVKAGKNTAFTFSARRSYVDAILNPILNSGAAGQFRAPVYYDFQGRWLQRLPNNGTLDVAFLVSDDRFRVLGSEEDGEEDEVQIGLATTFGKLKARWRQPVGRWNVETTLIGGPEQQSFQIAPDGMAYERPTELNLRHEWLLNVPQGGNFGFRFGADVIARQFSFLYDVPAFGISEEGEVLTFAPALYGEATARFGPTEWVMGLRNDVIVQDDGFQALATDPRLAARFTVSPTTQLKASVGRYSQFPGARQVLPNGEGNPDLVPLSSLQTSAGLAQNIGPDVTLEVTGFYNRLFSLVVGREDAFRFFSGPPPGGPLDTGPYSNEGTGRIFGGEALLKAQTERTVAWLSATVSRSERVKRVDSPTKLFEYDQTLILTALASHQLPKRWRIGGRIRFSTGNPFTPVVNRTYDLDSRQFRPVYGELDSRRIQPFFATDLRIDKDFVFKTWTLTTYLDVQNLTPVPNVELLGYNFDYSAEDPVNGIPPIPAFGLRGEW
jgi:TonB family protein